MYVRTIKGMMLPQGVVSLHVSLRVSCLCARVCACVSVCPAICSFTHVHETVVPFHRLFPGVLTASRLRVSIHASIHTYKYKQLHPSTYIYTYTYMHMHTHVHIHIHIYIYTYISTPKKRLNMRKRLLPSMLPPRRLNTL